MAITNTVSSNLLSAFIDCLELPPEFFCQTSFWQNDLVLLCNRLFFIAAYPA